MNLGKVKHTEKGRPYVTATINAGSKKGMLIKRFGKILKCPVCGKRFFARDEQIKKGTGKFCSTGCAKTFDRKERRKEELSERRSKKIKGHTVYFGEDGKIYTEANDKKGKIYRYYGEIKKCVSCGEDFFANFSQIRMNKAKFCSRECAINDRETAPVTERPKAAKQPPITRQTEPRKEVIVPPEEPFVQIEPESPVSPAKQPIIEIIEHPQIEEPLKEEPVPIKREEEFSIALDYTKKRGERPAMPLTLNVDLDEPRDKPVGILVFGILLIYAGITYFIVAQRASYEFAGWQVKDYMLTGANILLGYTVLRMSSWSLKFLYSYLILVAVLGITAYCLAFSGGPPIKAFVLGPKFTKEILVAFVPYLVILAYLSRFEIKEQLR